MIKSLRWRMQIWHALILLTVLVVYGSIVYYLQWQSHLQDLDMRLELTGDHVMTRLFRGLGGGGGWNRRRRPNRGERPNERRPMPPPEERARQEIQADGAVGFASSIPGLPERPGNFVRLVVAQEPPPERPDDDDRGPPPPEPPGRPGPDWGPPGERPPGDRPPGPPPPMRIPILGAKTVVNVEDLERLGFPEELAMLFDIESDSPYYFTVWDPQGRVGLKTASAPDDVVFPTRAAPESTLVYREFRTRNGNREMTVIPRFGVKMVLGESLTPSLRTQHATGLGLLLAGTGVLVVGLVGGTWISNRTIAPIRQMTETAESISAHNLSERINIKDTDSELGSLASVLNQTFERLEEAFDQQSRFTADASHELRTPVSVLLSQTELTLSRERSPKEYQESLQTCRRTAMRMRTLVEGLLFLARMDSGETELENDRFDLSMITDEVLKDLNPLAEDRQLTVTKDLHPTFVRSNRPRLQQVLTNLVTNAIRYNRPQGRIEVTVKAEGDRAVLAIRDTGIGIAEADLPHVFERFFRVDKARTIAEGGTGLGLAICKTIVESLHGTIEIESRLDVGTTVTVALPLERG
ncbi:MAG: HAMP domain-containing protein [Planctomycetaceae bacterium]|nr:HAMP domain-containing protein [Planctomycetaceae bacterium]